MAKWNEDRRDREADHLVELRLGAYDAKPGTPRTRADCLPGGSNEARPCRYPTCRFSSYYTEASEVPGRHREGIRSTLTGAWIDPRRGGGCVLDVVDARGPSSAAQVAGDLGISRRRVEQLLARAVSKLRAAGVDLPDLEDPVAGADWNGPKPIGHGRETE